VNIRIIQGDCIDGMRTLPDQCVHTVITSPPYYGLRDYGTATWQGGDVECSHVEVAYASQKSTLARNKNGQMHGKTAEMYNRQYKSICGKCGAQRIDQQIGLEESPDAYVQRLVDVFREVRRILRDDGTVWLNLGDSYGAKKQLSGIPWRVAFALQSDGWYLRQDIIWHKPDPMPESVTDRCTKAHEYIFLLAKSERYYYDNEAIKEAFADKRMGNPSGGGNYAKIAYGNNPQKGLSKGEWNANGNISGRNKRSVWKIATQNYKDAHFATYPTKLVEPCVLAGTSAHGCCATCGSPYKRIMNNPKVPSELRAKKGQASVKIGYGDAVVNSTGSGQKMQDWRNNNPPVFQGWHKTCDCADASITPCTVFDPFTGSATTAVVALQHGRSFIGTELNPEYVALAHKRLSQVQVQLL
jgi:DNA modification methylase